MLRLFLDEDVPSAVAPGLRRRGVDAISVYEVGRANRRITDEEQLAYASDQGRVMVTYNRADFQQLNRIWRQQQRSHAGIVWCSERALPRRNIGTLIRALAQFAEEHEGIVDLCLPLGTMHPNS